MPVGDSDKPDEQRTARGIPFRRLILIGGIACLAALALALWLVSARTSQTLVRDLASEAFENRARLALLELERLQDIGRAGAEALAAHPLAAQETEQERRDRLPALATVLRATPGISAAYLGWPDGDFLLLRPVDGHRERLGAPEGADWMAQWILDDAARFEFLDAALAPIAVVPDAPYDLEPLTRPWFQAAETADSAILTPPYVFFTTREPGLTAARRAASGAVAGVDMSLSDLSVRLAGEHNHPGLASALISAEGGLLAHSAFERAATFFTEFAQTAQPGASELPPADALGSPVLTALADRVREGQTAFFETTRINDTTWLVLASPIDAQGTTFLMYAPRATFAAGPAQLSRNLQLLFLLSTLTALGLVWYGSRRIARPVEAMADDVERLARLDFQAVPQVRSNVRELSRLGQAVTTMQTTLASYSGILTDAVRQPDLDAALRTVLVRLQQATAADRALYWACDAGEAAQLPPFDTASDSGAPQRTPIPADLARQICALDTVQEIMLAETAPENAGTHVLAIPLRARSGQTTGAIALLRSAPSAPFSTQCIAIAEAVSHTLGLVIDRRILLKEHQDERRESEFILRSVADGIHVLDAAGNVMRQNAAAQSILGWTLEEVMGKHSHALIHHHRADGSPYPITECPIYTTLQDGQTRRVEGEHFFRKDGRGVPVDYECSALRDEAGAISGAVISFRDVSDRLLVQTRLRERVKELDCLYRVLELTLSNAGSLAEVCTEIARILPHSLAHETLATARLRIFGEEYRSPDWQPAEHALRAEIVNGTNEVGFVEVGYRTLPAQLTNDPAGIDAAFLEEENAMVKAVASHVGRMIHARLINERLTQTERLTAVGELTGGISHDFNNLLTVVMGNAELLEDRLATQPDLLELARMIRSAAEGGAELTHRLLAFARRQPLVPKLVEPEGLIRSMIALMQRTLGDNIEINLVVAPDLWQISIDTVQLESAVLNLAINARDAMPEGGRLTIELTNAHLDEPYADWNEEVTPGPYVLIAVSDTGKGMTEELRARVFEPFFTTKETGRGSGLGLSMVYGFVKQSQGHVRIYSEPDRGTTVKLYLPRADFAEGSADMTDTHGDEPLEAAAGRERILLVEDDDLVRDHTTRLLESMGYAVRTAPDGPYALELVRKGYRFDLLFTDLVMPGGMNGYELATSVRRLLPDVAVLCTSGYADLAVIQASKLSPDMAFLSKPYRRKELAAKIRQALGGDAGRKASSPA